MAVDITINETIDSVDITVNPNIIEVNVTRTSGGGGGGSQTLAQTLDLGNTTGGENIVINNADAIQLENTSSLQKGTYNFGGNGGISRICSNNYEDMWQNGFRHVFDQSGFIRNSTNCFNIVPDETFDVTLRFKVGSFWTLDNGTTYICTDATDGAAVWELYNVIPTSTSDLTNNGEDGVNPFITAADIPAAGVPYTGATADVNLGEFGLLTGNIEFDTTPTNIPTTAGSMVWNDIDGTVDLGLKGGNVTLQIGQEQLVRVVNKTATNIDLLQSNYQAVRLTGAQGQRLKVDLAQATTDALSAETIGLVTETIANNQEGFITTSGLVRGINTTGSLQGETWVDGDILYLSPTTAGQLTKVKPTAPNHLVIIGYVVHAHATQGSIFVKVDNGYELNELHNVKITSETNNQLLAYTSATDIWENKSIASILGYSPIKKIVSDTTSSSAVTGVTTETLCKTYTISANTFADGDFMKVLIGLEKTGVLGTATARIRVNQTNNFATATLVGTYTASAGSHTAILLKRDFLSFKSGVLKGISFNTNNQSDLAAGASIVYSTTTLSPTSDFYIYVSVINANAGDSTIVNQVQITN